MAYRATATMLGLTLLSPFLAVPPARADEAAAPAIAIVSPATGAMVALGGDSGKSVAVKVKVTNFTIRPAGQCGALANCGHVHLAIDYPSPACNAPGSGGNSTNGDTGGSIVTAHFAFCPKPAGQHVIAVALAHDDHSLLLVGGKPVSAAVPVTTR
jgi:hypothetical protein